MRERAELHEHIGDVNVAATTKAALRRAREALQEDRGRWAAPASSSDVHNISR